MSEFPNVEDLWIENLNQSINDYPCKVCLHMLLKTCFFIVLPVQQCWVGINLFYSASFTTDAKSYYRDVI